MKKIYLFPDAEFIMLLSNEDILNGYSQDLEANEEDTVTEEFGDIDSFTPVSNENV